jgi:hypothetical protein
MPQPSGPYPTVLGASIWAFVMVIAVPGEIPGMGSSLVARCGADKQAFPLGHHSRRLRNEYKLGKDEV